MRVKWLISVAGQTYGRPNGVKRGEVDDLPEADAMRLIESGYAQANWRDEPGPPYQPGGQPSGHRMTQTRGLRKVLEGWQ